MLILISDAFDASLPDKLKPFGEVTEDKDRLPEAQVVLVRSKTKCTQEYIDRAPNLKLIIRGGVGMDNVDREYAKSKGILTKNTPKASAIAVAELTMAMMLAVPNLLIQGHTSMLEGKFLKKELKRTELWQKTLCLVGVGNIGTEVAKRAKAFDMNVVAYRASGVYHEHADVKPSLLEAIRGADYISLNVPLNDSTRGMITAEVIDAMKPGVVLINTARAAVIDTEALVAALHAGKIRAYATDVWPSDPPPPDYPVLKAPNVLMLPHIGANSKENLLRIGDEIVKLIDAAEKGGIL